MGATGAAASNAVFAAARIARQRPDGIDCGREPPLKPSVPLLVVLAVAALAAGARVALASVPTVEECLEGSDFIANAARARDNGIERARFLDRLDADFVTIRSFPPALRWFARDREDEAFLRDATDAVFRAPRSPDEHRAGFLRACFARLNA